MQDMIRELEEEFKGRIEWRTFSIWYADSDLNVRTYGVFLFLINGVFHIRDYKHTRTVLGIKIRDKDSDDYVQFNRQFALNDIRNIYRVTKSKAKRCLAKGIRIDKDSALFFRIFKETVILVDTENTQYFFEFPEKEFRKITGK